MSKRFANLEPGAHIRVQCGLYWHHGIYIGRGLVVHFTGVRPDRKMFASVRYGTLAEFTGRRGTTAIEVIQYAHCLPPNEVIARAHHLVGRAGYHLVRNNCEQCARWCKTGDFVSNQVETAKAMGGGATGTAMATAAALSAVSAGGVVAGTGGAGLMSGLASAGGLVGGGAAAGVAVLASGPAVIAGAATHHAFRDDPALPARERLARLRARRAGTMGAIGGTLATVGMVSAAGVPGLSAVGIATGLTALGGSMVGGLALTVAAPATIAAGVAWLVYRLRR